MTKTKRRRAKSIDEIEHGPCPSWTAGGVEFSELKTDDMEVSCPIVAGDDMRLKKSRRRIAWRQAGRWHFGLIEWRRVVG